MFSTIDKAITALVFGLLSSAVLIFNVALPEWINEETIATVINVIVAPALVYFVANKPSE